MIVILLAYSGVFRNALQKPVTQNTSVSIPSNLDPDSNVTEKNDLHSEKRLLLKISTDEGTMILAKPVPRNARFSIRDISAVVEEKSQNQLTGFSFLF
jgi:hypothetical protein